jgi:O-antigen ligase
MSELTSGRTLLWSRGFKLFLESPIYGHGQDTFIPLMKKNFRIWGNSHNDYLLYAVHFGLIGLAIFLLIYFSLYREAKNLINAATDKKIKFIAISYLAGLASYMVAMFGVNIIQPRYLFWAYSAVVLKYAQLESVKSGSVEKR